MGQLYGMIDLSFGQEKLVSTAQGANVLGTYGVTPDGRLFKYSLAGEAIGAGKITMQRLGIANHDMDLVTAAAAIGASSITVTLGATLATLDQYKDGFLYVNDGAGEGHLYFIQGHPAAASAATLALNLGSDIVREAVDSASLCGLMVNPYRDVELFDADAVDGGPLGVAPTEIANAEFFWNQIRGHAAVLCDVAPVAGEPVRVSDSVDGAFEPLNRDVADEDDSFIGIASHIPPVTTDYGIIVLNIPG